MRKTPISMWREEWFCGDMSAFSLYVFLVASASTKPRSVSTNRWIIQLWTGQMVFDRVRFWKLIWRSSSCSLATCKRLEQKRNKIRIQSDKTKTIVTILDYLEIVGFENTKWQSKDSQKIVEWQSKDTKKNDKNEEIDKNIKANAFIEGDNPDPWSSSDSISPPPTPSPKPELFEKKLITQKVDKCLEIIKSYNEWTINWSKGKQRQFASHLIKKIEEMPTVSSWKFSRDQTLDLALSIVSKTEHYSQRLWWPEEIFRRWASIIAIAKKNANNKPSGDLSQYDIK